MSRIITNFKQALHDLQNGAVIAMPTETVYGLAAVANNITAVKKVFTIKKRPANHPLILHISENDTLEKYVSSIPAYAKKLITEFWPGPLTLIFNTDSVNLTVTGGHKTVAMRCPKHPLAQKLLKNLDYPLVAPSANPFGKVSPTCAQHVLDSFPGDNFLILDGGRCARGIESTLIDASADDTYHILRHGVISFDELKKVATNITHRPPQTLAASGNMAAHYQPSKKVVYFEKHEFTADFRANILLLSDENPNLENIIFVNFLNDPRWAAFEFYNVLRNADIDQRISQIYIKLPPNTPLWAGVRERIIKSGSILTKK